MNIKTLFILSVLSTLLYSCATVTQINNTSKSATSKVRYVTQSGIEETPVFTDLVVEEKKTSGSFSGKNTSQEVAKNIAVYNALKVAGAEVLVEPLYQIEINNDEITVNVEGYPARYKNFRQPTAEDSLLLGLTPPRIDTVIIEKKVPTATGSGNNCCCCGGGGMGSNETITSKTVVEAPAPEAPARKFDFKQPVGDNTPSVGQTDAFKQEYIAKYNRYQTKGKKHVRMGIISLIAGAALTGTTIAVGIPYLAIPSSLFLYGGIGYTVSGAVKLNKAKKMKANAAGYGIQLAMRPVINPMQNTYAASLSVTF